MTYRSEEQVRRAQIEELTRELDEAKQEVSALRKKLARAEEKAAVFRRLSVDVSRVGDGETRWKLARWFFTAGLLPGAVVWSGGALLGMLDMDRPAWSLVNLGLLLGIIGPVPAWYRAAHPMIGLLAMAVKLGFWLQIGSGWWTLSHERLVFTSGSSATLFFWVFPPAVLAVGVLEAMAARWTVHHDDYA
jgi:hypothetical protein